eukprot:3221270-Prymnesium_polylepis.1
MVRVNSSGAHAKTVAAFEAVRVGSRRRLLNAVVPYWRGGSCGPPGSWKRWASNCGWLSSLPHSEALIRL